MSEFFDSFFNFILEIAKQWGLVAAITVAAVSTLLFICGWLLLKLLGTKDAEIERLVKERNKLQDVFLNERLSTNSK